MYRNKMWPSYPAAAAPTMVSPAMQAPTPNAPAMVSPAMQTPSGNAMWPSTGYPSDMTGGASLGLTATGLPGLGTFSKGVAGAYTGMPATIAPPSVPSGAALTPMGGVIPTAPPATEESYIENILRMNLGKVATIYMTFENNREWNAKIFKGILEAAGRDHIIISDPTTGRRYVLLMVNLDYITFDEPLVYTLPFGISGGTGLTRSQ